jgi:2-oxoglutarate dehydrogenase E1 component
MPVETQTEPQTATSREATFDFFRRWGYLQASLDPLGQFFRPSPSPSKRLRVLTRKKPAATTAPPSAPSSCTSPRRKSVRGLKSNSRKTTPRPIQRASSPASSAPTSSSRSSSSAISARNAFHLEGLTVLIPFLDQLFSTAADNGVERGLFAMAHRGRLNVMVNTVGRGSNEIFTRFEDVDPRSTMGGGDVKYHMGATGNAHHAQRQIRSTSSRVEPFAS